LKKNIIIAIVLLLILILAFMVVKGKSATVTKKTDNAVLLSSVDVITVRQGNVDEVIDFTGDLSPLLQAVISSEVDAVAEKVLVSEGQYVAKNQTLAILDNVELNQAVSSQKAILASAQAKFELDKNKLERQKSLLDQGFISKIAYDELKANYQSSLEAINQQKALLQKLQEQLSHAVIKAPFAGYVYQKNIDNGQLASKNSKLFSIANLERCR